MIFRYDNDNDVLDIILGEDATARTEQIDSGTLVDLDQHGRLIAIEVIAPSRPWPLEEILQRFDLAEADRTVLRDLWREGAEFPFARSADLVTA